MLGTTNLYNIIASAALITAPVMDPITVKKVETVSKIESLTQIPVDQPAGTLFLFDLDDTVFDFPHMLGSQAWRRYIVKATEKMDKSTNWHDDITYFLAKNHQVITVESNTAAFIKDLQDSGYIVCGFTARERQTWYNTPQAGIDTLTNHQLNSIQINFNNKSLENTYPYLALDSAYFEGTFFANCDTKGEYASNLFKQAPELPTKVVFLDDKGSQAQSVDKALTELGIEHECYEYTGVEAKAKTFNSLLANIQLHVLCESKGKTLISDKEARLIAEANPDKKAEAYLLEALEMATASNFLKQ